MAASFKASVGHHLCVVPRGCKVIIPDAKPEMNSEELSELVRQESDLRLLLAATPVEARRELELVLMAVQARIAFLTHADQKERDS
jgi:hypothetical protein